MMLRSDTDSISVGGKLVAHRLLQASLGYGRIVHTVAHESTERVDGHDLEDKQKMIRITMADNLRDHEAYLRESCQSGSPMERGGNGCGG